MNFDEHPMAAPANLLLQEAKALRLEHNPPHQTGKWDGNTAARAQYNEMIATARQMFAHILITPTWHQLPGRMPDSDTTVLLFDKDASEPIWPGYYDGQAWRYVDGTTATPTHWQDFPKGPEA